MALVAASLMAGCGGAEPLTDARVTMHRSRFTPARLTVPAGVPVTFELRNDDPIEHEWIIGAEATHARHRTGTEPHHGAIPTEVSVAAYTTIRTTITFDKPGEYTYICHLPGHEAYGMKGTVTVVET